jgi:hypothetical protein
VIAEPSNSRNKPTAPKAATINPTPPSPLFAPVYPPVTGIATSTHYSRLRFTFHDFFCEVHSQVPNYIWKLGGNFAANFRTSKRTSEVQSTHGVTYVMACEKLTDFLGNIEQRIGKESYEIITNTLLR